MATRIISFAKKCNLRLRENRDWGHFFPPAFHNFQLLFTSKYSLWDCSTVLSAKAMSIDSLYGEGECSSADLLLK